MTTVTPGRHLFPASVFQFRRHVANAVLLFFASIVVELGVAGMSRLFRAAMDATEEAIVASLFAAETVHGYLGTAEALPIESTQDILRAAGRLVPASE